MHTTHSTHLTVSHPGMKDLGRIDRALLTRQLGDAGGAGAMRRHAQQSGRRMMTALCHSVNAPEQTET
jgi:hypothetical protein